MRRKSRKDDYIIAIGASAGGLEELYRFFENVPLDGVTYVVIQHLSADFKSRMAELLNKHSVLEVMEAEHDTELELNMVYFIPGDKFMFIRNNRLQLMDKKDVSRPHNTINTFFKSLAEEKGARSIGVILSGTGDDGREGVQDIKKAGGMVIASDPIHAVYSAMPQAAIETEAVDFIIIPELMPQVIVNYVKTREGRKSPVDETEAEEMRLLHEILEVISDSQPLDFSEYKPTTILRRIKRRASSLNFSNLGDYLPFLKANTDEAERLSKDFLISVTSFFRDTAAFAFLEKEIIPAIVKSKTASEEIKVWVAGCATGEEAYSLAMLFREHLQAVQSKLLVKIFATDIDSAALAFAAKGIYPEDIVKTVGHQRLEEHFIKEHEYYRVKPALRRMLIFSYHDIVKNPPYCNMDLISCRNLLIYLSAPLQKKIMSMLHFGLKKKAFLFLGSSENNFHLPEGLELLNKDHRVYQNNSNGSAIRFGPLHLPEPQNMRVDPARISEYNIHSVKQNLAGSINEAVMQEMGYMVLCTDTKNNVVQTFGDTAKFLLQKNFENNIIELLPASLALAFKTASFEAAKFSKRVTANGIAAEVAGNKMIVNIVVKPLLVKNDERQLLMSIFSDLTPNEGTTNAEQFDPAKLYNQYTLNIEDELGDVKEKLYTSYEKLDAYKENMQSFNEELLAANEELQSANEEMQSVNEELYSINTAYLLKNKELSELNDDLNNYFRSNVNGQLFVNKDLHLMKFSPNTVLHINLKETDIGRPIEDITTNIKLDSMIGDIKTVIESNQVLVKEIETLNGKWYQMLIMPYIRESNDKNDGAIISFSDITELIFIQKQLTELAEKRTEFLGIAAHELRTPLTSLKLILEMLNDQTTTANQNEYTDLVNRGNSQVDKITTLIKNLLDVAKSEHGDLQINTSVFNVREVLLSSIENVKADYRDCEIINSGGENSEIKGDRGKIEQVFSNIITNAVKYSPEHCDVHIEIKDLPTEVMISIRDHGIGIPLNKIPFLFDRFYRVDKFNKSITGLGLGLYISNQIVKLHNGRIEVKSIEGKGSTFNIYLPKG